MRSTLTANKQVKVECAWCGIVMSEGEPPVSHGICESCEAAMEEEEAKKDAERQSFPEA